LRTNAALGNAYNIIIENARPAVVNRQLNETSFTRCTATTTRCVQRWKIRFTSRFANVVSARAVHRPVVTKRFPYFYRPSFGRRSDINRMFSVDRSHTRVRRRDGRFWIYATVRDSIAFDSETRKKYLRTNRTKREKSRTKY